MYLCILYRWEKVDFPLSARKKPREFIVIMVTKVGVMYCLLLSIWVCEINLKNIYVNVKYIGRNLPVLNLSFPVLKKVPFRN